MLVMSNLDNPLRPLPQQLESNARNDRSVTTNIHDESLPVQRRAEHKKFYYKGEQVILTSKAGCSTLNDAYTVLEKNFSGLPVIQTYRAVGDGKRPQHRTVLFGEDKIIVTGKKSSGLVGQVYDMLDRHFNSLEKQPKKQTLKVLPIVNDTPVKNNPEVLVRTSEADFIPYKPVLANGVNVNNSQTQRELAVGCSEDWGSKVVELQVFDGHRAGSHSEGLFDSSSTPARRDHPQRMRRCHSSPAPSTYQEQKKLASGLVTKSLFSKAITAIHSQSQGRSQVISSRSAHADPAEDTQHSLPPTPVSQPAPVLQSQSMLKPSEFVDKSCGTQHSLPPFHSEISMVDKSTTVNSDLNQNYISSSETSTNHSTWVYATEFTPSYKNVVEDRRAPADTVSGGCVGDHHSIEPCVTVASDGELHSGRPETTKAQENNPQGDDIDQVTPLNKIVYSRFFLLELSQNESATLYPRHIFVDPECEIILSNPDGCMMFDKGKHRLPQAELAMSNIFPTYPPSVPGARRHFSEPTQPRKYLSASDPLSWGDPSGNKRGRKPQPGVSEALYSESAYNCMETIPECATYCTELDEVFKNNAKVVPGVAFTKRPRESRDSQYVQELLDYYESSGH